MTLFRNNTQFIILPAVGFVLDGENFDLVISWLFYGLALHLFRVVDKGDKNF